MGAIRRVAHALGYQPAIDNVASARKAHAIAIDGDAFARGCLPGYIKVFGEYDTIGDIDDSRHIKHNDAVRF